MGRSGCGGPMPQPRQWRAGLAVIPALLEKAENEASKSTSKRSRRKRNGTGKRQRNAAASPGEEAEQRAAGKGEKRTESPTTPSVSRACLGSKRARECFVPARSPSPGSSWCSAIAHRGSTQEEGKGTKPTEKPPGGKAADAKRKRDALHYA